jgi:hypothetical protein
MVPVSFMEQMDERSRAGKYEIMGKDAVNGEVLLTICREMC